MPEQDKDFQRIIAKCWADEAFKQALIADPVATLRHEGIELPAELRVTVLENTPSQIHLVIPPVPTELSDDDLDGVAGGLSDGCGLCLCILNPR